MTTKLYNAVQKFGVSGIFVLKEIIILFSKDAFNWSKVTVKTFILLQKIYIQIVLFSWTFYSSKSWKKKVLQFPQKYEAAAQLFST